MYDDDLGVAHVLADAADSVTMARFKALDLQVKTKPDMTPVTDADQRAEESIRSTLKRARPRDAVIGEEFGTSGHGARQWVIDPIDGTKSYIRGVPVWATLIGLLDQGEAVLGVVSAPALGRRWWAGRGSGAWTGRNRSQATRCQVSHVSTLSDASLSYSSLTSWDEVGRLESFLELAAAVWRTRAYGDFWSHVLVADGAVDISCEPHGLALHDLVALQPIVEEAGGRFTDLAGEARPDRGSVVCTNGILHDDVLAAMASRPRLVD
ncbi:MAG: histidinol-phosphatase [Actinomycetota bacterium]|nr:histidinol-phosphatase [Actinomycetota bacterium]